MYSKLFPSMYEGSLVAKGPWEALVTFQQMLILADAGGNVDMTLDHISRRTRIPLDVLEVGVQALQEPDPESRSPELEGRRIVLLEPHRTWGWRIVNFVAYHDLRNGEDRRTYMRLYQRKYRKKQKEMKELGASVDPVNQRKQNKPTQTHTQTQDLDLKEKTCAAQAAAREILQFLNTKAERSFREVPANLDFIKARMKAGATIGDFKAVIARQCREWKDDPRMSRYLRPETLFSKTHFESYLGQREPEEADHGMS